MNTFPVLSSSAARAAWRVFLGVAVLLTLLAFSTSASAEDTAAGSIPQVEAAKPAHEKVHERAEHGLPSAAVPLYYGIGGHPKGFRDPETGKVLRHPQFGPFAITNSMLFTWIVALGIIIFAQCATRDIRQIPDGLQNFWEWLVEGLRNFLEGILGRALTKKTFWYFATVFIFILFTNWFGLIPGVGTIGWGHVTENGFHVDHSLLRGANADVNMTGAMSIIFFGAWIVWAIQSNGFGGLIKHIFAPKGESSGYMKGLMVIVFGCVGLLEIVSILFRPISLSFRLYGNIFAGENVLEAMSNLVPILAPVIPIPFYFMELLVGIVQALVFMLLTAVFTLLICSHGDESHESHGHH